VVFVGKSVSGKRLAAAILLLMPLFGHAAGLGKLTVLSQLGQPLNAEIELVSLQPGEEESLAAKLASADAFNQAGIEINPALLGVRFAVERRTGRGPVIRVSSSQPVNEPFLEMLVEVQWASGRLVREYSFLLDPPEYRAQRPIAAAPAKPAAVAPAPAPVAPRIEQKPIAAAPVSAPAAKPAAKPAGTYEVKKGDTLGKIAEQNAQPGVSVQQMLIALYRANQDAFIGDNINRLRSGRILTIPDREAAAAVDQADAVRLVQAQGRDFAEYQRGVGAEVAKAPAAATPAARTATGKIAAKPEAAPPAEPKDQLKLSKADPKKSTASASKAAKGDDAVARERALKDAQARVQDLEKNLGDLQKLLEIRNQQLAELEKKGAATKPAPAKPEPAKPAAAEAPKAEAPKVEVAKAAPAKPEPAKAEPAKPEPAKPEPAKPEPAKPEPVKPEATTPVAAPVAEAPKADPAKDAPKPAAEAPKPKPKPAPPPPPPPPPSIVDQFLDNPLALGGLGGVVALLAGYGAWAWRRKKATQSKFQDSVLGGGAAGSASVLNAGAADEADDASVSQVSVSDASVGRAEADDVDPIAEADVYMAYGRDAQAEEILKEALAKDPGRVPVLGKLLEIYANRRDAKSFEASALKLNQVTGGEGADWEKAAALGRSVDPGNGLYGGSGDAAPIPSAAPAAAPTLDFDIGGGGGDAGAMSTDLSLDLGGGEGSTDASAMDFDLGGGTDPAAQAVDTDSTMSIGTVDTKSDSGGLDFDLGGETTPTAAAVPEPAAEQAADAGMDFDLNLDLGGETTAAAAPSEVDLSAINLDLGGEPSGAAAAGSEKWQEVATKLDLAKAYEEMGDKDGARDLLNEVLAEGDAAQQAQAKQMISALG